MSGLEFFSEGPAIPVAQLAADLGLDLRRTDGSDGVTVASVAPLEDARPGSITFLANRRYARMLADTRAAAVIVPKTHADAVPEHVVALVASDPYRAFALAAAKLYPSAMRPLPIFGTGISEGAHIHPSAALEDDVIVEPGAVIGSGAQIGAGAHIGPNATVGSQVAIGRGATIAANATVVHALIGDRVIVHSGARIGSDGFGFAMGPAGHAKIPQIGRVVIQDDVEIGPNTVIDRGSNRDTIVGEGTKIDGQIMIGHNVQIGRHCVLAGLCGIAGSSTLEDYVVMGAGVSVNGHVTVGMGAQLMGKTVVVRDIPRGVQYGGDPARPLSMWRREMARERRDIRAFEQREQEKTSGG